MTVRVITAPSVEPVSRAEAKLWIREDGTDQDSMVDLLIQSMREYAENLTGRAFVQRTLEATFECFPPDSVIVLPCAPLVSVAWVKYYNYAGTLTTVDAADYEVDAYSQPGRVQPVYLKYWEPTRNVFNAVQVRYDAGYAPTSSPTDYREKVPASLKLWMHARLGTLYDNREQLMQSNQVAIPRDFADGLLDSLKVGNFFG